jgi:serine protease
MRLRELVIIKTHTKLLLSTLLLVGLFTYSGSVSAVKNGEKCLKVGAKTVTKGVAYKCSKNAKGIKVWRSVGKSASTPTTVAGGVTTTVAGGVTTTVARGVTTTVARGVTTTGSSGDRQGPILVSGSVTPGSGDISTSSLTITVTVRITDATGVRYAPSGRISGPAGFSSFSTLTLISGDSRDGTYSKSFVIPQGRPAGNYYIGVSTPVDTIGNGSGSDGDFGSGPIPITSSP